MRFADRYLAGECGVDAIHDHIDAWHNGDGGHLLLHEYLGLSQYEYARWVESGALERLSGEQATAPASSDPNPAADP